MLSRHAGFVCSGQADVVGVVVVGEAGEIIAGEFSDLGEREVWQLPEVTQKESGMPVSSL
jgi:hypothetical protein